MHYQLKIIIIFLVTFVITACGLGKSNDDETAVASTTLSGRLIDTDTRQPLSNITVKLLVGRTLFETTTVNSDVPEINGSFSFSNISAGNHRLKIAAENYAVMEYPVDVLSIENINLTSDLGDIPLSKGYNLNINVKSDDAPATGVVVVAKPVRLSENCVSTQTELNVDKYRIYSGEFNPMNSIHEPSAVSNDSGLIELSGLNKCLVYKIISLPFDTDGDAQVDYAASEVEYYYNRSFSTDVNLVLEKLSSPFSDFNLKVTMDDTPVANHKVNIKRDDSYFNCNKKIRINDNNGSNNSEPPYYSEKEILTPFEYDIFFAQDIEVTTNDEGVATISGLSACSKYLISVPGYDSDDDKIQEFVGKNISIIVSQQESDIEVNLEKNLFLEFPKLDLTDEQRVLNVLVTHAGEPVSGVVVKNDNSYYYSDSACAYSLENRGPYEDEFQITDSNGLVTFKNIVPCRSYEIKAFPHDLDNDGIVDFKSASERFAGIPDEIPWISLSLEDIDYSTSLNIVSTSGSNNSQVSYNAYNHSNLGANKIIEPGVNNDSYRGKLIDALSPDSEINIVFSKPIKAPDEGDFVLTYYNNLINPDADGDGITDATYNQEVQLDATVALDEAGMILTITPASPMPINEMIHISGFATALLTEDSKIISRTLYIENNSENSLSASTISAGIYPRSYSENNLYLEFPEYVTGIVKILSIKNTSTGALRPISSNLITISSDNGYSSNSNQIIFTTGNCTQECGSKEGVFYIVNLIGAGRSNNPEIEKGDELTVLLNVRDVVGNVLIEKVGLVVD